MLTLYIINVNNNMNIVNGCGMEWNRILKF